MNYERFEDHIQKIIEDLPDWEHEGLDNIEVPVVDEPDHDMDPEGEGLLGLYLGMPLPERGTDYAGELPDGIYIFRQPHLELGLPLEELKDEIAHYFGMDDDHLDEIGWG